MKIRAAPLLIAVAACYISCAAHAAQIPVSESDVSAQILGEISSKNQMLTAKSELWYYGTTHMMKMCSDGVYISDNPTPSTLHDGGLTLRSE